MEPVEAAAIAESSLGRSSSKTSQIVLIGLLGMGMRLGVGDALVHQPGVQLVVALDPKPRREEALAHETDLVLDLAFLPARRRRAGHRFDEMVRAHLEEAAIVLAVLADEDRLHRGLHVVVDAARAGAPEERERLAHARRTPSPGSRADRRARTSSGCGTGGHARPSQSSSRRPSQRSRGSSRTGRLRPAQTTKAQRRSRSGCVFALARPWRNAARRRSRPRSRASAALRTSRISVRRSRADASAFVVSIRSRSAFQRPSFGARLHLALVGKRCLPRTQDLRTVLREIFRSRAISLIDLP